MAIPLTIPDNSVVNKVLRYEPSPDVQTVVGLASKASRLLILNKRIRNHGEAFPDHIRKPIDAYETGSTIFSVRNGIQQNRERARLTGPYQSIEPIDRVILIDVDFDPKVDVSERPRSLTLPFVPQELDFQHSTKYAVLATLGANHPKVQFTGSEESLTFVIDWHSFEENRLDVLRNCKWLEALSKADGWGDKPHRLAIEWGRDPVLLRDSLWVVEKADYKLSQFNAAQREASHYDSSSLNFRRGRKINTKLMPKQAYQTLQLRRVVNFNLTSAEIGDYRYLNR